MSNRNLALARAPDAPPGAAVLNDFFPTATGVVLRRGNARKASVVVDDSVLSIFSYVSGAQSSLFAAVSTGIRDITTVAMPDTFSGPDVLTGQTSGSWNVVQFATAGGEFLVGVNGADDGFLYDGSDFYPIVAGGISTLAYDAEVGAFTVGATLTGGTSGATAEIVKVIDAGTTGTLWLKNVVGGPFQDDETITDSATGSADANGAEVAAYGGITFPSPSTLTTADLSYVWVYKQRIWFLEKGSLNAWYLSVDQVGGELTLWPMGGVFVRGGTLIWGQAWSSDSGSSGGLSEQCVFTTTEGEVAAYQGLSPDVDQGWTKVGMYRIGRPMGDKAFMRAGGDIVVATTVGFVSLAAASQQDYAALGQGAVSYPIEDDWAQAVQLRGAVDWRVDVWPDKQMAIVAPPPLVGEAPVIFVVNTNTGKWCKFRNWGVRSLGLFSGAMFFGTAAGTVQQAYITGLDEDQPYVGQVVPLFEDLGAPGNIKIAKTARAVIRAAASVDAQVAGQSNYVVNFPAPPSIGLPEAGSEWGVGLWDEAEWGGARGSFVIGEWVPVGAYGHDISMSVQITSGSLVPVDAELIRIDVTFTTGEIVT